MRNQIQSLTPLRGYAALFIVIHHFVTLQFHGLNSLISEYTGLVDNAYLMVDLFFILSGFVLAHVYTKQFTSTVNRPNYEKFLFARFARIYPLHIFVLLSFFTLELAHTFSWIRNNENISLIDAIGTAGAPFSGSNSLGGIGANLLLVHSWTLDPRATNWNHPSWSISSEWFAYLLVPFLLVLARKYWNSPNKKHQKYFIIVAIIAPLAVLFLVSISTKWGLDVAGIHGLVRCAMESWLGMIAYQIYQKNHLKKLWQHSLTLILFTAWITVVMWTDVNDTLAIPAFVGLILCTSYNSGVIARFLNTKFNTFLGEISYSVYMTHIFVMQIFILVWPKIIGGKFGADLSLLNSLALLALSLTAVLITSTITYKLIEIPARNWLKAQYTKRR